MHRDALELFVQKLVNQRWVAASFQLFHHQAEEELLGLALSLFVAFAEDPSRFKGQATDGLLLLFVYRAALQVVFAFGDQSEEFSPNDIKKPHEYSCFRADKMARLISSTPPPVVQQFVYATMLLLIKRVTHLRRNPVWLRASASFATEINPKTLR
jgi:hypothetical protein